jgi:hypothetical protein
MSRPLAMPPDDGCLDQVSFDVLDADNGMNDGEMVVGWLVRDSSLGVSAFWNTKDTASPINQQLLRIAPHLASLRARGMVYLVLDDGINLQSYSFDQYKVDFP